MRREAHGEQWRSTHFDELVEGSATDSAPSSPVKFVRRNDRRLIVDAAIDASALWRVLAAVEPVDFRTGFFGLVSVVRHGFRSTRARSPTRTGPRHQLAD